MQATQNVHAPKLARLTAPAKSLHPVFRDILLTGFTSVITMMAGVLVVSMVGRWMGPANLAEYLLIRRVLAWAGAAVAIGMGTALPRYVAYSIKQKGLAESYFLVACSTVMGLAVLVAVVLEAVGAPVAKLLFGASETKLLLPFSLLLISNSMHGMTFGYYRGRLAMHRANALQLINIACIPTLSVLVLSHKQSVPLIYIANAILVFLSAAIMAYPLLSAFREKFRLRDLTLQLWRFGIARVPGDAAGNLLFALGPMIAARYVPFKEVAFMLLGLSLLNIVPAATNPMNQVLLSKVSIMLSEGRKDSARLYIEYLLTGVLQIAVFVCLQVVIFADVIVRLWVGAKFSGHLPLIRICLAAIPFYMVYTSMRSVIDAASEKAYNARNVVTALLTFVTFTGLSIKFAPLPHLMEGIAAALVLAIIVLAVLTGETVTMLYELRPSWRQSAWPLLLGVLLGGVSYLIRLLQGFRINAVEFISVEIFLGVVFLAVLHKTDSPWLRFMEASLLRRLAPAGDESNLQPVQDEPSV